MRPVAAAIPATIALIAAALACPIQRPSVPWEYYDFRADLQEAVADTTVAELEGDMVAQERLDVSLTDLAAILTTDSLVAALDSDPVLWPLASAVAASIHRTLESDRVGGRVRSAFDSPDGQRLAVDAIVIGFGKALRRFKVTAVERG
ncbi:MAG: hypothetical protein JSV86_15040 [Gemmatimonadota bacterium]|nr:MAG: hypothetical protein JSV86_15040 [Gemmatimonadota bacterium]